MSDAAIADGYFTVDFLHTLRSFLDFVAFLEVAVVSKSMQYIMDEVL